MSNTEIKAMQLKWFIGVLGILFLGCVLLLFSMRAKPRKTQVQTSPAQTVRFASPLQDVDTAAVWKTQMQKALAENTRKTQAALDAMRAENEALKMAMAQAVQPVAPVAQAETISPPQVPPAKMHIDHVSLTPQPTAQAPQKTPETYVPSGTHVEAVLLGGADAAAGALNHANPRPLLLKLTRRGRLPNHRYSHLKNCVATAAVVGDISAARGGVRLERLSCVKPNGSIIDVAVQGTVYGMDGKNGIRGRVVRREGALMTRASVAGFFGGMGDGFHAKFTPASALSSDAGVLPKTAHIIGQGISGGASSAFSKIADYNIKRAEQYHPVIQISAGQTVDIVFTRGFFIRSSQQTKGDTP